MMTLRYEAVERLEEVINEYEVSLKENKEASDNINKTLENSENLVET
ncbi:hypothetical protein ACDI16_02430 [Oceanobacillus caeni]